MKYLSIGVIALLCATAAFFYSAGKHDGEVNAALKADTNVVFIPTHDYQVECGDSITIYDDKRVVGSIPYDSSKFVNLIIDDNQ